MRLLRLFHHPAIVGAFWIAYFIALILFVLRCAKAFLGVVLL